jgi:hypothetical protein
MLGGAGSPDLSLIACDSGVGAAPTRTKASKHNWRSTINIAETTETAH